MNNPLVQLDPGLFIWTIIVFLVLLGLLSKFAWTPLLVGILLFGIFPHLLVDMIDPAVNVVTAGVDALGNAAAGAGR